MAGIPSWILDQIILMIRFGWPKTCEGLKGGDDGVRPAA